MNIFAYGSLSLPEVMLAVAGGRFSFLEGRVQGYAQLQWRDKERTAMIPFPDICTEGIVYLNVGKDVVKRLDAFFGESFNRLEVNVETGQDDWCEAEAYVLKLKEKKHLTANAWDEDDFRQKHLAKLLKTYSVDVP
ncbi:MAG: gamma-glutamylcyclotransferase family protein [bacterium]